MVPSEESAFTLLGVAVYFMGEKGAAQVWDPGVVE